MTNTNLQADKLVEQGERILSITDITIAGVLIVIIIGSWVVIYKIWKVNRQLNTEIRGFIEKYYVLSTKILGFLSKGNDV